MNIKQTLKTLVVACMIFVGAFAVIAPTQIASATDCPPGGNTCCGGVATSIITCKQTGVCANGAHAYEGTKPADGNQDAKAQYFKDHGHDYGVCDSIGTAPVTGVDSSGIWGILLLVINILTAGIGIVAVAGIVYASILYTSAGGSAEQTKKAMTIIADIVIGVLAYALMYAVLNFLVPGGLFN